MSGDELSPSKDELAGPASVTTGTQFAAALSELRLRRGRSIRDLARATGIPSATLGGYFSGRHLPPATQPQVFDTVLDELGVTDPQARIEWLDALARARRDGPARVAGRSTAACPYRGLEPFSDLDGDLFYGREQVVADLLHRVTQLADAPSGPRMLMVVGASGSGKSSVLRAGLVAAVRRQGEQEPQAQWSVSVIVPGADPVSSLAAARSALGGGGRGLLVVDQAEEMFSPLVDRQARREFIDGLLDLAEAGGDGPPVVVVAALRADFYGQAAADPELLPVLQDRQVLLGAMGLDDLRRAVIAPAGRVRVKVDPELVDLLMRDLHPRGHAHDPAGYEAGALPLVSHALLSAWGRHQGQRLTVADYVGAGGIAGAVQQSAESLVAKLDAQGLAAAQWLFGQLVVVDDDGAMTRRRVRPDDLHHPDPATDLALDDVIEAFVSGRLLTAGEEFLEVSHEALLSAWPRLREWVLSDLDAARLQRRIAVAAKTWRELDRDPGALLRGGALADAQALAARPLTSARVLAGPEQEFVAASSALAEAEATAAHRRTRRLQGLVAVMTVLALLAGTLTFVSMRAVQDANTARDEALSRQLAITADDLRASDPALAAQMSLAAYRSAPTLQARSSLLDSTAVATPTRFTGPAGDMSAVASPDGRTLAISGLDGVTRLWQQVGPERDAGEVPEYQATGELASGSGPIYASAFSPDGRWLAIGAQPGLIVIWDMKDPGVPQRVAELKTDEATVYGLAFSSDSGQLAAGTSQPAVRRWAMPTGSASKPTELPSITEDFGGSVHAVAFRPGEDVLATGSEDGEVRTWTAPVSGPARLLGVGDTGDPANFVLAVAFAPDGSTLLSGDKGGSMRLWNVKDLSAPRQTKVSFPEFDSWVNAVAYSPDGSLVAGGSSDASVQMFNSTDATLVSKLPCPDAVTSVQFVASGDTILTSEVSGTARLWPFPGPTLGGFADTVWNVVPVTAQPLLAVGPGRADGRVHLFDTSDPASPRPVETLSAPASAGPPDGAAWISPDGRWVAAGTSTGRVIVWERDPDTGSSRLSKVLPFSDQLIEGVTISPDGTRLAAIADDSRVGIWRLRPGAAPKAQHDLSVAGLPLIVAFNPDTSLVAVGTTDRQVHLWQLSADGSQAAELPSLSGFTNYVYSLAFHPSGKYLAAGSTDRTVRIWDMTDPTQAQQQGSELRGPQDTVYSLAWNQHGDRLAGGATGGTLWLWDVTKPDSPLQLASLTAADGNITTTAFSPDGRIVYAGGPSRTVNSWASNTEAVEDSLCQRTGTSMTEEEWQRLVPGVPFTPPCPL